MVKKLIRNPAGSKDWLPDEVVKQEYVKDKLVDLYELWGYQPIQTPILINRDSLTIASSKLTNRALSLIGETGNLLALRADLTTPIARVTAERLHGSKLPLRFYYVGKVFRYHARKMTNERELFQIGVELIGKKEGNADLECLKIFLDSLEKLGFNKYMVLANHACLWSELFKCFGNVARELYKALSKNDLVLFENILLKSKLTLKEKAFWRALIKIKGKKEILSEIRKISRKIRKFNVTKIISTFKKILDIDEKHVEIDLGMTNDIDYYSGIYFEAITPYLGRELGGGGRYDELIGKFGLDLPAIGFSFCLEDLLLALENQGKQFPAFKTPSYVKSKGNIKKTFDKIAMLHRKGKSATIQL